VEVEPGTSVLEAARAAGVRIRNDCGGRGACGRCIVHIRTGEVVRLGTRYELRPGEDLACRTLTVESDVEVFVPKASREVSEEVTVRQAAPLPSDQPSERAVVRAIALKLPPPSLEDNLDDHARLVRGLKRRRQGHYELPEAVLRELPHVLRESDWNPAVTVAAGPHACRVLKVSGETPPRRPCILAVDVGTTALKAQLLAPGCGWQASCYNSQVMYGPDVISRIMYCQRKGSGLGRMQHLVVGCINGLIEALTQKAGIDRRDIWAVIASGNTTMIHLLCGLPPLWIRREPYVGCSYHLPPMQAAEVGIEINPLGRLYCIPAVSAYVGGDITAGVLSVGLAERERPAMLIDLGTNGEIVVGNREFLVCCSASAGPAFEGEASASGTRAMPGAIQAVYRHGDEMRWETIGGEPPVGICGSGYIDLLAVLLELGVVDRTARFQEGSAKCLRPGPGAGSLECLLVSSQQSVAGKDIVLTQADLSNLVRAKGAIYAAASILLKSLGMSWDDMDRIMLAGAFGERINKDNAVKIGLLPDVPRDRIEFVGNTSLEGAIMVALDEENYARAESIAGKMTYLELSTHPDYMNEFVAACFLPHTDAERFPSVARQA